jgi:hypothetical protein
MVDQFGRPEPDPANDPPDAEGGVPRGVWYLLGAIATAKVVTIAVVLGFARTGETGLWAAATTWHWVLVAAVLLAGPILFRLRLRRVRARREMLRRAEWMIEDGPSNRAEGQQNRHAGAH